MTNIAIKCSEEFEQYAFIKMTVQDWPVGYVNLIRSNNVATIADIFIYDKSAHPNRFLRWFKITKNYRGNGYGSNLLTFVINFCIKHDINELKGIANGELDLLKPWYKKHGFTINDANEIYLELHA